MRDSLKFRITATATLAAVVWAAFLIAGSGLLHGAEASQAPCDNSLSGQSGLTITYPLDGTVFPPEIVPPRFIWEDQNGGTDTWQVAVRFLDGKDGLALVVRERGWTPSEEEWETIKSRSVETEAAGHFSDAIRIQSEYADARRNLQVVEALMGTDSD